MSQLTNEERIDQVNLQELVENYIWNKFKSDTGFPKKLFLRKSRYYCDIRWGHVEFNHKTTATERPKTPMTKQRDLQLYYSQYENKTAHEQSYTFSTSRETTSTTSVELQENYTIGAETNLEINFGEVVKLGGGISGSMSVTDTKGEEFSKTVSWDIDTEIKVPSWNKATASLHVYEEPSIIDFEVETTISLAPPSRALPVTIKRRSNDEKVKIYWIENLECLFSEKLTECDPPKVKLETRQIGETDSAEVVAILTTRGTCRNVAFQNQHVEVECQPIEGAPTPQPSPEKSQGENEKDGE